MKDEKPPFLTWMPLYIERFLTGTMTMTAAEIGAYLLLLLQQWEKSYLVYNKKDLMKLARCNEKVLNEVLKKFTIRENGTIVNEKCAEVRIEQEGKYVSRVDRAKKGAEAKHKQSISTPQAEHKGTEEEREEDKEEIHNTPLSFISFWDLYNKKVGDRDKCKKKWIKLSVSDKEKIMSTLPAFLRQTPDKQFRPNPQSYLNAKRWNDELGFTSTEAKPEYQKKTTAEDAAW